MTDFTADADALDSQGSLHTHLAQFYRDVVSEVRAHGGTILREFQRVQNTSYAGDYAGQYQQWLSGSGLDELEQEAHLHETWAQYFYDLADEVRQAEKALSGNNPSPRYGRMRFE
jgi:hypothetical protein